MISFGITITVLVIVLIIISILAYKDNQKKIAIFGMIMAIITIGAVITITIHESNKSTAKDTKIEVLQHLNNNQGVTLTLTLKDKTVIYQLNDSTMVDLFNYLTKEDDE